jgi:predicted transcriptional regulator
MENDLLEICNLITYNINNDYTDKAIGELQELLRNIKNEIEKHSITAFELGISVQAISENSINMIFEKFLNEKINIGGNK